MKKILVSMALILTLSSTVYATGVNGSYHGHDVVKVTMDGKEIAPDSVPGYIDGGSTMIPLGMMRKMGVTVEWDAATKTANIKMPPPRTVPVLIQSQLDELSKYVYKIEAPLTDDPKQARQGSGFLIGTTLITNYHVIQDSPYVLVQIDGKWQKFNNIKFKNETVDLAGVEIVGAKSLPYSSELPRVGDPVYDISFPHGELKVTEGVVYGITKGPYDITQIVHTANIDSGSSGGALLNGKGEIIGVNKLTLTDKSFAIPIMYVEEELKK